MVRFLVWVAVAGWLLLGALLLVGPSSWCTSYIENAHGAGSVTFFCNTGRVIRSW